MSCIARCLRIDFVGMLTSHGVSLSGSHEVIIQPGLVPFEVDTPDSYEI